MTNGDQRQFGRAKNSVLSMLERKLSVPRIYIDASWAEHRVDVLAIDRDGVGDVHVALLFPREYFPDGSLNIVSEARSIEALFKKLESIPAQFKYVVAVDVDTQRGSAPLRLSDVLDNQSFAPDGLGRIGLVLVDFLIDGDPQSRIIIKPERFRAKIAELADAYVQEHSADWEIRA